MNPQFEDHGANGLARNSNNNNYKNNDDRIFSTETKEEHVDIIPLEIENGSGTQTTEVTAANVAGAAPHKAPQRGFCARHKGKLICLSITFALLLAVAIAVPLLMPKDPTATLLEQSNLRLDGLGTGSVAVDLRFKVDNPNRYAISFQNLKLDVYNFNGAHIGEVTRQERFFVPGRSSESMKATAFMQPSFFEILAMGINCLQNDNLTKLKVRGTAEARFAGRTIQQEVGPFDQLTQCVATNINGRSSPPPPGVAPAGIGNGQIIQGIGQAIQDALNGAGAASGGAGAAPGTAAPVTPGVDGAGAAPVPGAALITLDGEVARNP